MKKWVELSSNDLREFCVVSYIGTSFLHSSNPSPAYARIGFAFVHTSHTHSLSGLVLRLCPPIHAAGAPLGVCLCFLGRANTTTDILSANTNSSNQPSKPSRQPSELWRLQLTLAGLRPSTEMASLSSTCSLGSFATISTNSPLTTTSKIVTTVIDSERPSLIFVSSVVNSSTSTTSKLWIKRLCSSPPAPINSSAITGIFRTDSPAWRLDVLQQM